tara:strand:+ start:1532 stop:2599 length:1068 start_codon:yes stop_codon:yes gene_type:complete
MLKIKLNKKYISNKTKTYFIADIAANHDGSLSKAKKLIRLCAKAGADCAKFQHFKAETIVSDSGFKKIKRLSHQKKWKQSVFDVYKKASINPKWTKILQNECKKNKIDFMTAPYDLDYVDQVQKYICAYKIGSGDINWKEIVNKIRGKKMPVFLATGASSLNDVKKTVKYILEKNKNLVLMQCNTNYTNSNKNFNYINLNVLKEYKKIFRDKVILGLSDHTPGHSTVLGAVALGARVVEKHFTNDNYQYGPDHLFSMNPKTWKLMVDETRNLEKSLGDGVKKIEKNEEETSIVQRRGVWINKNKNVGSILHYSDLSILRPCPKKSISPFEIEKYIGKKFKRKILKNDLLTKKCFA